MTTIELFRNDVSTMGFAAAIHKHGYKEETAKRYMRVVRGLENEPAPQKPARVLVFDIETLPMVVYSWGLKVFGRLSPKNIIKETTVLSWAAKWLNESEIISDILTPKEAIARNDKRVIKKIWKLFEEADIVIAHNGDRFDIPKLNARFWKYNITPPLPYQTIDTLKQSFRNFGTDSHKQEYLTQFKKLPEKFETDFPLWVRCDNGDQASLNEMLAYNRQDVTGLEEMYYDMRPWMKSHPNMGMFVETDKSVCPTCGSENIKWGGYYNTTVSKFGSFRCNKCGAIGRCRQSSLTKEKRAGLVVSIAR